MSITQIQQQLTQLNNNTANVNYQKGRENLGSSAIGKDGFLQLMMTQLKLQNPLEPVDNTQQLLQQASFTQVEELQKLNATLGRTSSLNQAAGLVGNNVTYTNANGTQAQGRVDSATFSNNALILTIGGQQVDASKVTALHANP
jgi:flagellar basal-body rod modification protein FlgD